MSLVLLPVILKIFETITKDRIVNNFEKNVSMERKVPRSPAAPHKEKKRKKQADRKVPDRPGVVKGERL
jgi:hypothetical protein